MKTCERLHLATLSFCAALLVGGACTLNAQSYRIDWYKVAGGGGASSGGNYALTGTVGQPDAGPMAGGQYALAGGFWAVITAVQMPGAPLLTIRATGPNTVVVSWPSPSSGFVLEQKSDLNGATWVSAPQTVNDDGTTKSIVVNPPVGNLFYRLKE